MRKQKGEIMAKSNEKYDIVVTRYVKKPTGKKSPKNAKPAFLAGKPKYGKAEKQGTKVIKSTWGTLKQGAFEKSSKNDNVSVRW